MEKQYWLANAGGKDQHGTVWEPELLDGPHSAPRGVAEAKKIIQGIGLDRGKNREYIMVTVEAVPEMKTKVNKKAIALCKEAVDRAIR